MCTGAGKGIEDVDRLFPVSFNKMANEGFQNVTLFLRVSEILVDVVLLEGG